MQFAVIVLCVPLQLFISNYMGSTESNRLVNLTFWLFLLKVNFLCLRTYAISKLVTQMTEMRENWFRVEPWRKWCWRFMSLRLRDILDPYADPMGECPAVEVFRFRDKNGYFGQSPEPRDVRPPHIMYRVGQVVKHKR